MYYTSYTVQSQIGYLGKHLESSALIYNSDIQVNSC